VLLNSQDLQFSHGEREGNRFVDQFEIEFEKEKECNLQSKFKKLYNFIFFPWVEKMKSKKMIIEWLKS
jgi:hypothetical protein